MNPRWVADTTELSVSQLARPEINFRRSQAEPWSRGESPLKRTNSPVFTVGFNRLKLLAWDLNPRWVADTNQSNSYTPLLVQNEIVTLPSISTVAIQRRQLQNRSPVAKTIAVIADPIFNLKDPRIAGNPPAQTPDTLSNLNLNRAARNLGLGEGGGGKIFDRLAYTRDEANKILALVPEAQRFQAFDFNASRQTATNPDLAQYQIIHFATHGLVDPIAPELSGVVLSLYDQKGNPSDGFLRLHDIFNLNLPAELVVLSACETGLGENVKGEGLVGLTRGFMYAGARRVVVSLWSVNDAATSELMAKFYQKMLQGGQNPITALREAQLEMWNSANRQSPYYWAAFTVQGDWR
ncbi:TPR domain protein [Microseira wollei NIES-4236]|uniref:TPR domain protein n=1 Tax=Microseira wollei NIES-4236 TaxID=2530354 RepID=A0AAV3XL86_9CYAN|nr:TPR domain protein [Microseira wollei NIES-4236]